jgi:hypothetical protein
MLFNFLLNDEKCVGHIHFKWTWIVGRCFHLFVKSLIVSRVALLPVN